MEFHPIDTRKIFKEYKNKKHPAAHLWYQIHYDQYRQLKKGEKKQKNVIDLGEKKYILKDIKKDIKRIYFHQDIQKLGERVNKNRLSALMELSNAHLRILKGKLTKSIVQGLGYEHVRETSLSIHPIYGFPYIPGSSIKGLVRRWFIEAFLEGDESQLVKSDRQLAEVGREIFGIQDQQGVVQFLDIYMFNNVKISNDIMTPHFSDYYDGKKAATDTLGPVPIYFYTVEVEAPEIEILFIVRGGKNSRYPKEIIGKIVADWTKSALVELGLGAKTSSGYGFFNEVKDVTEKVMTKQNDKKNCN